MESDLIVDRIVAKDIRFPTSIGAHGSDAMHPDPDYSCAYVLLHTSLPPGSPPASERPQNDPLTGHALTFTIGRGTEVIVACINSLAPLVTGRRVREILRNFSSFWRELTSDTQLRWIGPEKGVIHLATSALVNALWDLWARIEGKPLWKLVVDMDPELLVSTIDFRYITDVLTPREAVDMLRRSRPYAAARGTLVLIHCFFASQTD